MANNFNDRTEKNIDLSVKPNGKITKLNNKKENLKKLLVGNRNSLNKNKTNIGTIVQNRLDNKNLANIETNP
jgi:hypothetical protein